MSNYSTDRHQILLESISKTKYIDIELKVEVVVSQCKCRKHPSCAEGLNQDVAAVNKSVRCHHYENTDSRICVNHVHVACYRFGGYAER